MKKTLLCLLLLTVGCSKAPHHANELISQYIKQGANDPNSYEAVSFGAPSVLRAGDIDADTVVYYPTVIPGALIKHTYRSKNSFGALMLTSAAFVVDSIRGKVVPVKRLQAADSAARWQRVRREVDAMEHEADSVADAQGR